MKLTALACLAACAAASPLQSPFFSRPQLSHDVTKCPGYRVTHERATKHGHALELDLAGKPCHAFGMDDHRLTVQIDYEDERRLRVHIGDAERKHVAFPESVLPSLGSKDFPRSLSALEVHYETSPFALWVTRRTTGEILFDTRSHTLVFEDQYLQIGSALPIGANIYGLGEVASTSGFRRNENATRQAMWAHDRATPVDSNLYGAHPVYLEHRPGKGAHVVFMKTSHGADVVLAPGSIEYRLLGGNIDLYFIDGPTPKEAIQRYVSLIGLPQMQQRWTLGFHLCRWGYNTIGEMREVVTKMREARIPHDAQWVDIDYMRRYEDFTVDADRFPAKEVKAFLAELEHAGQHMVPIIDLGIAIGNNTAYNTGLERDVFLKHHDGHTVFTGKVWPGYTTFPDFFAKKTAKWWTEQFERFLDILPVSGIWADMNEAANFCNGGCDAPKLDLATSTAADRLDHPAYRINTEEESLVKTAVNPSVVHANGLHQYDTHNLFGLMETQAINTALREIRPNERPFILSRSTFPSSGTVAAHWLGDNWSTWEQLYLSLQGVLQFGFYGVPLVGPDVCGFSGDSEEELCGRWMQLGALAYPFMRNHNVIKAKPQEPYFWDSVAHISRKALRIRYSLMPYLYTLLADASQTGTPITRALFWEWPADPSLVGIDRQVMLGSAILVTPVLEPGATTVTGVLPGAGVDVWYDYYTGRQVVETDPHGKHIFDAPWDTIPIYLRGGEIVLQHEEPALTVRDSEKGPFSMIVALEGHGSAIGHAYFDDGVSLSGKNSSAVFIATDGCLYTVSKGDWHISSLLHRIEVWGVHQSTTLASAWTFEGDRVVLDGTETLDLNKPQRICWK